MVKINNKSKGHGISRNVLMLLLCMLFLAGTGATYAQVARITDTGTTYTDLTEAFYDASAGQTVELLQDVDISVTSGSDQYCAEIPQSIIFKGNGHTLTVNRRGISVAPQSNNSRAMRAPAAASTYDLNVTIEDITIQNTASQSRGYGGRCITTRGKLGSLTLSGVTLTTDGSSYNNTLMPLYIGGSQATAATINVTNSSIIADANADKGNAITTVNPIALNISGSTLTAATGINFAEADESAGSNGSTVNITNGSTLNSSAASFYFYDNNISVAVDGGTINAGAGSVATFGSTTDNNVTLTGPTATYTTLTDATSSDVFTVTGGEYSQVVSDNLLADGYICHKVQSNGKYLVEEGTYYFQTPADGAKYPLLSEAIACVEDGGTIELLGNVPNAAGTSVPSGSNFTLDFKGYTYTLNKPGAGSTDTQTQGFQLLKNSTITFKNGTINISEDNLTPAVAPAKNIYRIIQNYANLTLEDMTIDGTNQYVYDGYIVSFNNGTSSIIGNTSFIKRAGDKGIFDIDQGEYYPDGDRVTINTTGTIGGNIEVSGKAQSSLTITNATVQGTIVDTGASGMAVTVSGGSFTSRLPEEYCAEGLVPVQNQDGTYGVKQGEFIVDGNDGLGYESLADAIAAGNTTLTLRASHASEGVFTIDGLTVASDLTIDLNSLTLQSSLQLNGGTLTFKNGIVNGAVVANGGTLAFDSTCGTNEITVSGSESLALATGKFTSDIADQYLADHYATNLISGAYVVKATVQIATVADLQALATLCNSGSTSGQTVGNTYELTADLDLSGVAWTPIGGLDSYPGTAFKGTFDGKNHTISNLTCTDTHANYATAGLFGGVVGATIKNLTLTDVNIQSTHYAAALVAYTSDGSTTVENCHVQGGSIVSTPELVGSSYDNGDKVGAIFGYANNANIVNCSVEDVTLQAYRDLGGLAGYMNAGAVEGNTLEDVTLTQDNTNGYKTESDGSLQDMSGTVGLAVGGRSAAAVQTQANNAELNTTTNVVITAPVVVAMIGEASYSSLSAAIAAATEGQTVEICKADTYTLPNLPLNITVKGAVEGVVFNCEGSGNIASVPNGATFENVTMKFGTNDYHGFQHAGTINMNGCTLNGKFFSYADMNFTGCTFNAPGTEASGYTNKDYSMWAYAGNLTYTDCTFNCAGKCVNVYNENGTVLYSVTAEDCTFDSSVANKAAFNVKATCNSTPLRFEVVVEDCEATGSWPAASTSESLVVLNALVQVDDIKENVASVTDVVEITNRVEEVLYTTRVAEYNGDRYDTLVEALDAAEAAGDKNIVVNLLHDATLTIAAWSGTNNQYAIGTAETESITINGDNHTLTFMTTDTDWNNVATMDDTKTKLILNDMTLDQGGKNTNGTWNAYDINFDCAVELNNVTANRPLAFKNAATVNNVTINVDSSKDVYGMWIQTNGQNVTIDGLTMNVPNGRGIAIKDEYVRTEPATTTSLDITNATFTTAKKAAILVTAKYGAAIEASNLDITNVTADNVNAVWVDEDLANQYGEVTLTGDATMIPEGGVDAYTVIRTTGEKVEGYYTDLQKAVNEAEDGQTVTLAADFDLAATALTVNTDADITIDGHGHSITSSAAQAVSLKGSGDVTLSNVTVNASAGSGIQVGDGNDAYSGELTLANSTLNVANRGINVLGVAEGFDMNVSESTIQLSTVADPTTAYDNNDKRGIALSNTDGLAHNIAITNTDIQGFTYIVNVYGQTSNYNVTMMGGKTYGRAALNVWGHDNTFTLDGVEVHGLNNQTGPTEAFGCIVENESAYNNTYNINGTQFVATLSAEAMAAEGNAAQKMFVFRGGEANVNITRATTYTTNDESGERSGLIENEAVLKDNVTILLDAEAKASLSAITDALTLAEVAAEAVNGMYALGFVAEAQRGASYYRYFAQAFDGLVSGDEIVLLRNATMDTNIATTLTEGEAFALTFGENTLSRGEYTITLAYGVAVATDVQVDNYAELFIPVNSEDMVTETEDEGTYTYTVVSKESEGIYEFVDGTASPYALSADVQAAKVTYTRSFDENRVDKYQAWFLPFDYTITDDDLEQFTFYKINMIANSEEAGATSETEDVYIHLFTIEAAGTVLKANKPYIYKPKSAVDNYEFIAEDVTLKAKATSSVLSASTTTDNYAFYGTYSTVSLSSSSNYRDYYMSINGDLSYPSSSSVSVGPYRWYLRKTSKDGDYARGISFIEDDNTTTAINRVANDESGYTYYTLDGHKVLTPAKGIYIRKSADGTTQKVSFK